MTKVTEGEWTVSPGNLVRVMLKGTGVCVAGVHKIGGRELSQIVANAQLIASSKVTLAALRLVMGQINGTIDLNSSQLDALQAALDRTKDIEL